MNQRPGDWMLSRPRVHAVVRGAHEHSRSGPYGQTQLTHGQMWNTGATIVSLAQVSPLARRKRPFQRGWLANYVSIGAFGWGEEGMMHYPSTAAVCHLINHNSAIAGQVGAQKIVFISNCPSLQVASQAQAITPLCNYHAPRFHVVPMSPGLSPSCPGIRPGFRPVW